MDEDIYSLEGIPDACKGIEKIGRSVSPVIQHLVEGKNIVIDAVV